MAQTIRCSLYPDAAIHRAGRYQPARSMSGASPRLPIRADAPARHNAEPGHAQETTLGSRDTYGSTVRVQPSVCLCYLLHFKEYVIKDIYVKSEMPPSLSSMSSINSLNNFLKERDIIDLVGTSTKSATD